MFNPSSDSNLEEMVISTSLPSIAYYCKNAITTEKPASQLNMGNKLITRPSISVNLFYFACRRTATHMNYVNKNITHPPKPKDSRQKTWRAQLF